jgi:TolB-like protein
MPTLQRFIAELQRRKVLRVAATYLVGAWIVLQVAVALQTAWALSAAFSGTILNLMILGFPVALGLTWFFEITPQGIKRTTASADGAPLKLQTTDFALAGALALVFVVSAAQLLWPRDTAPAGADSAAKTETAAAETSKPEPPRLGDKSIAVLPFTNLSKSEDDAFFADGLAEEVLNTLAHVHGIRVTSRTSSFAFKGKEVGVKEIAKQLTVRHVLEGSVRRDGESVRVTAQLIDTATDAHVWSETYERKLADVFTVQDEIARAIAGALNIEISVSGGASGAPTTNMEAYRLYLKARELSQQISEENLLEAIALYERAIAMDEKFAEAYANMAAVIGGLRTYRPDAWPELSKRSRAAAETALKLQPSNAAAHAVLGSIAMVGFHWEEALRQAERGLEIEPSNSHALGVLGHIQLSLGFTDRAASLFEETGRVDPLFGLATLRMLLVAMARGDEAALEAIALKMQAARGLAGFAANCALAHVARLKGDVDKAVKHLRICLKPYPQSAAIVEPLARAIRDPAYRSRAVTALLERVSSDPSIDPETYFLIIGANEDFLDSVARRIDSATRVASVGSVHLISVWNLAARGEGNNPKLKAIFRRVGLVDYWRKHDWPDRCRPKGEDDFECS